VQDGQINESKKNVKSKIIRYSTSRASKGQVGRIGDQRCQKNVRDSRMKRLALDRKIWGREIEEERADIQLS
jgi:hypothetical protein